MSESYSKPDKSLVATPVEELCGNPNSREGDGTTHGGVEDLAKESGGLPTVTYQRVDGK